MNKNEIVCAIDVNDFDQQVVDLAATFAKQFDVKQGKLVTLYRCARCGKQKVKSH